MHEKVIKPLKDLLKHLEIPNRLIIKRHDKLLDYEFARLNMEKLKDKYSIKTVRICYFYVKTIEINSNKNIKATGQLVRIKKELRGLKQPTRRRTSQFDSKMLNCI